MNTKSLEILAELGEKLGATREQKRIVAIINRTRDWHVNSPNNDTESDGRVAIAITYAIEVLDSILAEIHNG